MNIEISKKQFKYLVELVHIGNWVINSNNEPEYLDEKYEEVAKLIYSHGPKANLEKYVTYSKHSQAWLPTDYLYMKSRASKLIEEYDDHNFWSQLAHNFALRDFHNNYSTEKIQKMSSKERFAKVYDLIDEYTNETNDHGIERFAIIKSIPQEK